MRSLFHPIKTLKAALVSFDLRLSYIDRRLSNTEALQHGLGARADTQQETLARIELRQLAERDSLDLAENEFCCYSQWGEDGIIQFLLRHIEIENKFFVEFGVEDYVEANTRFLLVNNNWSGLVLDASAANIEKIERSPNYWKYNLKAVQAFVTCDNINTILAENGAGGDIGLLSIDIDGNDYWVWRAIDVIRPVVVIVEYNHRFGPDLAVTVPYDQAFNRWTPGQPVIYFGASLKALCLLADHKGYAFVGCNSHGVNAFFVRRDKKPSELRELSPAEGFVAGQFSELRDENGLLIRVDPDKERRLVQSLPLTNVEEIS